MPHINVSNINNDNYLITRDYHVESIDFISNHYPSIQWKNQLNFKKDINNNTINHIKELTNFQQLHSVFNKHSIESKMIISRGLNTGLTNAYNNLIDNKIHKQAIQD